MGAERGPLEDVLTSRWRASRQPRAVPEPKLEQAVSAGVGDERFLEPSCLLPRESE